jgi:hypothetical protein
MAASTAKPSAFLLAAADPAGLRIALVDLRRRKSNRSTPFSWHRFFAVTRVNPHFRQEQCGFKTWEIAR